MSNNTRVKEISTILKEPEWAQSFRAKRLEESKSLPKAIKHGIGISALFPETDPDYSGCAEYHVDSTKGLEIYTWKEAMTQEEVEPILKGLMESNFFPGAKDHFRALGQSLFASGLVVYVQPNMKEDETFITETLTLDTTVPLKSSADVVVVIVKEGAKLDFTSRLSGGGVGSVHARTLVVLSERGTRVRITQSDTLSREAMAMYASRAIVAGHAEVLWREVIAGNKLVSSMTENLLIGSGAKVTVLQGLVATAHAEFDIDVTARHLADDTHSEIRSAGVGSGTSRILYRGLVDIHAGVRGVRGGQEAKFLALSSTAKIDAIPSLDIASNEVNCTHKLSISHVHKGDAFYPKLRGLSDEESRTLFLEGHFLEVFLGDENIDMMNLILPNLTKEK